MATQLRIKDGKKWEFKGKIVVDSNGRLVKGKSEKWGLVGYTGRKPKGKLLILEGVTEISGWAFKGCTGLTSVTILSSEITIRDDAFKGCTQLKTVNLPEGLQKDNILQTKSAFEEEEDDEDWFSEDEEDDF